MKSNLYESMNHLLDLVYMHKGHFMEAVLFRDAESIVEKDIHLKVFYMLEEEDTFGLKETFANEYRQHLINVIYCLRCPFEVRDNFEQVYDLVEWDS